MKFKILIIEDDYETRENIALILKLNEFETAEASGGISGLQIAKEFKPDLILCDVEMPDLNGHGVLLKLREDPELQTIPFIFLTGLSERTQVRAGMNLGADDYVTKPVYEAELLEAIATRLRRIQELKKIPYDLDLIAGLTDRQQEILRMVANGKSSKEIAKELVIAEKTVETHRAALMKRLDVHDLPSLVICAIRAGLVNLEQS